MNMKLSWFVLRLVASPSRRPRVPATNITAWAEIN